MTEYLMTMIICMDNRTAQVASSLLAKQHQKGIPAHFAIHFVFSFNLNFAFYILHDHIIGPLECLMAMHCHVFSTQLALHRLFEVYAICHIVIPLGTVAFFYLSSGKSIGFLSIILMIIYDFSRLFM